jgi:hypothetical protein
MRPHPASQEFRMQKVTCLTTTVFIMMAMLVLSSSYDGVAQAAQDDGARREAAELRIEEIKERLALTPEQEKQLAPIIEARNSKLRDLRASHDGDTSRRARFAMLKEARQIQDDFNAQIEPILTKEQREEWAEIRKEARAAAQERRRERQ